MRNGSLHQRLGLILWAVSTVIPSQAAADALFTGRLGASACRSDGDVVVFEGEILRGEAVHCSSQVGMVHLVNTTIEAGSDFRASAGGGAPAQWGETECDPLNPLDGGDCNRCAHDVQDQFLSLFDDPIESTHHFRFREHGIYRPSGMKPSDLGSVTPFAHVQGFARTNSRQHPYVGTYSRELPWQEGAIFLVEDEGDVLELDQLHRGWGRHPTGAALLGNRIWFGDHVDDVYVARSLFVDGPGTTEEGFLALPDAFAGRRPDAGGGIGLAKLESGGYLLVTKGPGGLSKEPVVDFFYLNGRYDAASGVRPTLGRMDTDLVYDTEVIPLARWSLDDVEPEGEWTDDAYETSENLTVVTECGTGDLYVIGSGGAEAALGYGWHRLSRIEWDTLPDHNLPEGATPGIMGPQLRPVATGRHLQNASRCAPRAAASFWVNESHGLELYCSEWGLFPTEERLHFRRRRAR